MIISNSTFLAREVRVFVPGGPGYQGGKLSLNGGELSSDVLVFENGTTDFTFNSGTLTTASLLLSNTFSARPMLIGSSPMSSASLKLTGNNHVIERRIVVGYGESATGIVVMSGSQLVVTNTHSSSAAISLGGSTLAGSPAGGVGQLVISNGTVLAGRVTIAAADESQGTLTIAGGSLTTTDAVFGSTALSVGGSSRTGTAVIAGGLLSAPTGISIATQGRMTVSGGSVLGPITMSTTGKLTISGGTVVASTLTAGTVWVTSGQLVVTGGTASIVGQLTISNGTALASGVVVNNGATLTVAGSSSSTLSNLTLICAGTALVNGGSLFVTNAAGNAVLDVRGGTFTFAGGLLTTDKLVVTNSCGRFIHNGGTLNIGTYQLSPSFDADGDGMANGWEQAYSLDPLNAADVSADNDGDGMSNLAEYQAGTDPTNGSSAFRVLSVESTNNDVLVTWSCGGGRTNVVQLASDLAGSYTNVGPNIVLPGSSDVTTNWLDVGAGTNAAGRFYRIRLVP